MFQKHKEVRLEFSEQGSSIDMPGKTIGPAGKHMWTRYHVEVQNAESGLECWPCIHELFDHGQVLNLASVLSTEK